MAASTSWVVSDTLILNGTPNNDNFSLSVSQQTGRPILLSVNAPKIPSFQVDYASLKKIVINGLGGRDNFGISLSTQAIPPSGLEINSSIAQSTFSLTAKQGDVRLSGNFQIESDLRGPSLELEDGANVAFVFNTTDEHVGGLKMLGNSKAIVSGGEPTNALNIGAGGLQMSPGATLDLVDDDLTVQSTATNRLADLATLSNLVVHVI